MRITFAGAASTGKTTILNEIRKNPNYKDYINTPNIRRTLSKVLNNLPINDNTTFYQQYSTGIMQSFSLVTNENILADTSIITIIAYTLMSNNINDSDKHKFENIFKDIIKYEDKVFYTPIEFNIVEDELRKNDEDYRRKVDATIKNLLDKYSINYITLTGSTEERLKMFYKFIEN